MPKITCIISRMQVITCIISWALFYLSWYFNAQDKPAISQKCCDRLWSAIPRRASKLLWSTQNCCDRGLLVARAEAQASGRSMYEACMTYVWRMYDACMKHVKHVWSMYEACLKHVWCTYAARLKHSWSRLLYTSPSLRDATLSRMQSSAWKKKQFQLHHSKLVPLTLTFLRICDHRLFRSISTDFTSFW